jgi:nucleotide-binding universal stress UspA family protein
MQQIPEIRRILFASDLSETSKHAFSYALSLARAYKAHVVFLYVMGELDPNIQAFVDLDTIAPTRRKMAEEAKATLLGKRLDIASIRSDLKLFYDASLKDMERPDAAAESKDVIVTEGNVVETILRIASEQNCDAIVLGSRRRGVLAEAMFGSVAKGVLRHSDRLVIVAPPASTPNP